MKIAELMSTELVTATPDMSLKEAARRLATHGVSGLPVVDADDKVVGVLSEADVVAKEVDQRRASGNALVRLLEGPLLDERFDDPVRFARDWEQDSALGRWLATPAAGAARVVLAHHPDIVLDAAAFGGRPDLVVAGHTHGGQIRLPGFAPLFVASRLGTRFARGQFRVGGIPLIVTSGVGTSIVPVRIGVPPEIAVVDLVPLHSPTLKEGL